MPAYEYPLALDSELGAVELFEGLALRPMDEETRRRLLGISDLKLDEQGRAKSYTVKVDSEHFLTPDLDRKVTLYASNFILTAANTQLASDFNFALKLMGNTWSSLFIGYQHGGGVAFCAPPCYFGKIRQKLDENIVQEFQTSLLAVTQRANDAKLGLMRDIWMYAMSDSPRRTSRFVEISTLLEMLLLPRQSAELGFRFALRVAKLGTRIGYDDQVDTFEKAKSLYAIRSKLVHSGADDRLQNIADWAYELARRLLAHYLTSPIDFNEDALDRLCIAA
jgi:hypothetical protein